MKINVDKSMAKYVLMVSFFWLTLAVTTQGYAESRVMTPANNQKSDPLLITLSSQKVVLGENGKETFLKADKVKPGDVVEYKAVYRNRSKTQLAGLKASLPIPFGMQYVEKTASPASVFATVDGTKYEREPLMRMVKDNQGKEKQEPVPYAEYQSLRWEVGNLDAGKKIEVRARMRVNQLPVTAAELVHKSTVSPGTQ